MARFFLFLLALTQIASADVMCVRRCIQRSINGTCFKWGSDFCGMAPETACIPHCIRRSPNTRCMGYGHDFCGYAPDCTLHCQNVGVSGNCLQYGADACLAEWP